MPLTIGHPAATPSPPPRPRPRTRRSAPPTTNSNGARHHQLTAEEPHPNAPPPHQHAGQAQRRTAGGVRGAYRRGGGTPGGRASVAASRRCVGRTGEVTRAGAAKRLAALDSGRKAGRGAVEPRASHKGQGMRLGPAQMLPKRSNYQVRILGASVDRLGEARSAIGGGRSPATHPPLTVRSPPSPPGVPPPRLRAPQLFAAKPTRRAGEARARTANPGRQRSRR